MTGRGEVQVLLKANPSEQVILEQPLITGQLKPSSIRARPELLSLSANNLSYANAGTVLNWWSTYPVPTTFPKPYNDVSRYGICPAWGYARTLESKVDGIIEGDLLWGFWPLSSAAVDLQLEQAVGHGHMIETSYWRKNLMPLYNRYIVLKSDSPGYPDKDDSKRMRQWTAIFTVWQSGYMLNKFVFSKNYHMHPMPESGQPWQAEDSDLTRALVVTFASSGKTARSFAHQIATNRPAGEGPDALLEVGSSSALTGKPKLKLKQRNVGYEEMLSETTLSWIISQEVNRIVMVDFGGRNGTAEKLFNKLKEVLPATNITVIGVGSEVKVFTPADWTERMASAERLGKVQSNASGQRIAAITLLGTDEFFAQSQKEFEKVVKETMDDGRVLGVRMTVGKGFRGTNGIAEGWKQICAGAVSGKEGLVYDV